MAYQMSPHMAASLFNDMFPSRLLTKRRKSAKKAKRKTKKKEPK